MPPIDRTLVSLPSRLDHVDLIQKVAEELARIAAFDDDGQLDIGLAVREGSINAIKHGNECDASRPVEISFSAANGALEVVIRDQGRGFDVEAAPDPTAPENLWRTSGRGLLLIRSLVDRVDIESKQTGTTLVMTKKRARDGVEPAGAGEAS